MSGDDSDDGSSGDDAFADLTESDLALVDDLQNAVESQPGDYTAHSNVRASLPPLSRRALTPLCTHSWWRPSGAAPCGAGCTIPAADTLNRKWNPESGPFRRFGASLRDILKHFPFAARSNTHVLPVRPLGVT